MPKHHTLTKQAEHDLADMVVWSNARWGETLTDKYLDDIYAGSERIGKDHVILCSRKELSADSGLLIYPVRKHYVVCHPVAKNHVIIVAYVKQGRDVPSLLEKNRTNITRELKSIVSKFVRSKKGFTGKKKRKRVKK